MPRSALALPATCALTATVFGRIVRRSAAQSPSVPPGFAAFQYQTPHVDPGSLVVSDDVPRGELSASAARMVMKLLWLARLSRPDTLVAVTLLATKVTAWSSNEDRTVARLVGYVSYSAHYSSIWFIADASQSLSLSLYVHSDFGGCLHTARSTSG